MAITAEDQTDFSPGELEAQIHSALPALEKARQIGAPLRNFASVDAVIAELKPTEPVFCISPGETARCSSQFPIIPRPSALCR